MRVVCLSDTHGKHRSIREVPNGDVLIHAGDIQGAGEWQELEDFNEWLGELPHQHKLVIAGNHDKAFFCHPRQARLALSNAVYLEDEEIVIEGIRFWGSPWTPVFFNWYFMLKSGKEMSAKWNKIPDNTDVLVTHGPPQEYGDRVGYRYAGCPDLADRLQALSLSAHIFGHIHEGYGEAFHPRVGRMVNVSSCTAQLAPLNPPVVLEVGEADCCIR